MQSPQKIERAAESHIIQKKPSGASKTMVDNRSSTVAQKKMIKTIQGAPMQCFSKEDFHSKGQPVTQRVENSTGIPDKLKSGMESLSGMDLSDVKVHYNSSKPASVQAHAFAQGSNIHIASGQERHLGHELGHVVQQRQGRVQPTTTVAGMAVNDNPALKSEATKMGEQALRG